MAELYFGVFQPYLFNNLPATIINHLDPSFCIMHTTSNQRPLQWVYFKLLISYACMFTLLHSLFMYCAWLFIVCYFYLHRLWGGSGSCLWLLWLLWLLWTRQVTLIFPIFILCIRVLLNSSMHDRCFVSVFKVLYFA